MLTRPQALLLALMQQYLVGGDELVLLVAHKLAYFLQVAREDMGLTFEQARYGPYTERMNNLLEGGPFILGYDGSRRPYDKLELLPDAFQQAHAYLNEHQIDCRAAERVAELIEGFDTPYGLELLSSVHWGAVAAEPRLTNVAQAQAFIAEWNERKRKVFRDQDIQAAWEHLHRLGWLEPAPAQPGK